MSNVGCQSRRRRRRRRTNGGSFCMTLMLATAATLLQQQQAVHGFVSRSILYTKQQQQRQSHAPIPNNPVVLQPQVPARPSSSSTTSLQMFMGSDGGILGIGGPEVFTILLVGYFVLGPSDLYKVVKEIGKFVQNIQSFSTDLTKTFENNMEDQLQLNEIRKAQQELTDAFSFRRTINVDRDEEAFATTVDSPRGESPVAAAVASSTSGKKILRRRVKKKIEGGVSDLEMPTENGTSNSDTADPSSLPSEFTSSSAATASATLEEPEMTAEEQSIIDQEFEQYTATPPPSSSTGRSMDGKTSSSWFNDDVDDDDTAPSAATASRFQQQLSGNWNNQVMANEEKLEPLAAVMQQIALLQEEKAAAEARLQEEFQRRELLEQEFYDKQKSLLEDAALQIQSQAFAGMVGSAGGSASASASGNNGAADAKREQ